MTALGGIFYAQSEFKASGVAKVIDGGLGSRTTRKEGILNFHHFLISPAE